jgi:hypothetical protein
MHIAVVQSQVFEAERVCPGKQSSQKLGDPEQLRQLGSHGRHVSPETKYPVSHTEQIVCPPWLLHSEHPI